MKRLILITLLAFGFATANAQYYQLRYDSVRVVSKFKLGNVATGASTDSILTKKANGGVYKIAQSSFATPIFQRSSGNITPITSGDRLSITTSSGTTAITAISSSGTGNAVYAQASDYNAISAINTSSSYAPINVLNNGSGALASFSNGTLGEVATVNNNGTITSAAVPTMGSHLANKTYVDNAVSSSVSSVVEITGTSQTAQARRIYIPHNASLTTITLPSAATVGDLIQVIGEGAGKWRIQHGNSSDTIKGVGGFTTTAGTSRGVETADQYGTLSLRYANTNVWVITTQNGSIAAY